MSRHIIEQFGKKGMKSTRHDHARASTPRPGDVVDFRLFAGKYPFTHGRYGRVDSVGGTLEGPEGVHVCCGGASVFLNDGGSVSISGGPFICIKRADLGTTSATKAVKFWNWGDHLPGGDQGVDFALYRPVFLLERYEDMSPDETPPESDSGFWIIEGKPCGHQLWDRGLCIGYGRRGECEALRDELKADPRKREAVRVAMSENCV